MAYIDDPQTRKANQAFIRASMAVPLLEREEELELARQWRGHGDEKALHRLIKPYMRLSVAMATRFRPYGLPMGDLVQEGVIGLLQAAARFEPERGLRFSTYASWWIRAAMQDYVLRNWSIVRTGTTLAQKTLFFNLRRLRARIAQWTPEGRLTGEGRTRLAKQTGISEREIEDMENRLSAGDQSLNAPMSREGDMEWQERLVDAGPSPEQATMEDHDGRLRREWLDKALAALPDRDREIIRRRRLSEDSATLEELGVALKVSKERVRQLEVRALQRLKTLISEQTKNPEDLMVDA
ncbi:MAG: RNA polymerase factor sigma-32 [Alphaproteobacteria bacterium]|nr:MAG: RNA polymerase factor sigma-32 [Alphaproteobacteria bacterium]